MLMLNFGSKEQSPVFLYVMVEPWGTRIWFGWTCAAQALKPTHFKVSFLKKNVPTVRGVSGNMFLGVCIAKQLEIFRKRAHV